MLVETRSNGRPACDYQSERLRGNSMAINCGSGRTERALTAFLISLHFYTPIIMHLSKFIATVVACSASLAAAAPVDVKARDPEADPGYGSMWALQSSIARILKSDRLCPVPQLRQ
jgi:hypothetical protein